MLALVILIYTATQLSNVTVNVLAGLPSSNSTLPGLITNTTSFFASLDNATNYYPQQSSCALGVPTNITENWFTFGVDNQTLSYNVSSIASTNCLLVEGLSGATIAVALILGLLQCYTCHFCGLGGILDFAFAFAGSIAWGVTAGIINTATNNINNSGNDPNNNDSRFAVTIMCWVEFGFFLVLVLASCLKCCVCCGRTVDKGFDI